MSPVIQIGDLNERIESKTRKEVTKVRTNPTPLAALINAIVFVVAETENIFIVKQRT